jgi:hypothetical protein
MSQLELLTKVIKALEEAGIEYMATGSLVSSMQGEPRSTHDIDLIVALTKASMDDVIEAFRLPEYYLEKEQVFEAIERGSMFNLIDTHSGDKVDFWMLTDDPFDQSLGLSVRGEAKNNTGMLFGCLKFSVKGLIWNTFIGGESNLEWNRFSQELNMKRKGLRSNRCRMPITYHTPAARSWE